MAKVLMLGGAVIFLLGVVLQIFPQAVSWFGKLPGDIRYQGERTSIFIPITSMVLLSIVLSALAAILGKGK